MPPKSPTLARLSWTFAPFRLTSSMKSFLLSSARSSSRWASSTASLVCIPVGFNVKARADILFFFLLGVVAELPVTCVAGAAVAGARELPGVYRG